METKGLEIGGYESSFFVDLVASYCSEVTNNQFKEVLWRVIYRDNGLYFCTELSQLWREKIHIVILKARKSHVLGSIRVRMHSETS